VSGEAATLILTINEAGEPVGGISFSSLAWAMGRIAAAQATSSVEFSGFSGPDGFEDITKGKLQQELLRLMQQPEEKCEEPGQASKPVRPLTLDDLRGLERVLAARCGDALPILDLRSATGLEY
jgi:hypothetical protein